MMYIRLVFSIAGVLCSLVNATSNCMIGTNFTRPAWKASNDMFMDYKNVSGDNPWNPQFLEDCKIYKCIRNMDADHINGSSRSEWSQRPVKSSRVQSPIAYEWMIDICNRVNADLWVSVPHLVVSANTGNNPADYAIRLAILLKTGVDMRSASLGKHNELLNKTANDFIAMGGQKVCEPLKSNLKVYLEYSNETWNVGFAQTQYCQDQGAALNLGDLPGSRFHGWAAIRIFRGAELVFGVNSPRIIKVLAGKTKEMIHFGYQLKVVKDSILNPWKTTVNALSIAPYFGNTLPTIADMHTSITLENVMVRTARKVADANNLKLFAYEAGQHLLADCITVNSKPEMYQLYREYLDSIAPNFDLIAHFSQVGIWGGSGCWGAKRFTGQLLKDAHKYRALVDWIADNPYSPTNTVVGRKQLSNGKSYPFLTKPYLYNLSGQKIFPTSLKRTNNSIYFERTLNGNIRLHIPTFTD